MGLQQYVLSLDILYLKLYFEYQVDHINRSAPGGE